jgi:hypothetical protein
MEGSIWLRQRVRQPARRHQSKSLFRNGERVAVRRALTGARIRLGLPLEASTYVAAAEQVGSTPLYVEAMRWLLKAEDPALLADALAGRVPLLAAATEARKLGDLIAAFRKASRHDRAVSGSTLGIDEVFDDMIVPSL